MSLTIAIGPLIIQKTLLFSVLGLLCGMAWLRWNSMLKQDLQKQVFDQLLNVFFYYIIALILAKVIILREFLFTHPTTIFVTPANKLIFYLAIAFVVFYMLIKQLLKHSFTDGLAASFVQVIVVAQFLYTFLMYIFLNERSLLVPMLVLALLLLFIQLNPVNQTFNQLMGTTFFVWIITNLLFTWQYSMPFFLYYVDVYFWLVILLVHLGIWFNSPRKQLTKS